MSSIRIEYLDKVREDQKKAINDFYNLHHGKARTLSQWEWEFESNAVSKVMIFLAYDGEKLIGMELLIPIYLEYKGARYLSAKSEDSVLDPEYRGKGIYRNIYKVVDEVARKEGLACIWGYTESFAVYEKLGFDVLYRLESYVYRYNGAKRLRAASMAYHCLTWFLHPGRSAQAALDQIELPDVPLQHSSEAVDIDKNPDYFSWRCHRHPYNNHYIYRHAGAKDAALVDCNHALRSADISDLYVESRATFATLLAAIMAKYRGYSMVYQTTKGHPHRSAIIKTLRALGFFPVPHGAAWFIVKHYDPALRGIAFAANGLWTEGKAEGH